MHLSHKCKHARAQCSLSAPALILKTPGTTRALWSGNWERAVYSWRFQRVEKKKKGPIEASLERRLVFWYLYFHWKRKKEKRKKKTRVRRGGVSRGRLSRVFHPPAQAHRPPHHVSVYLGRVFKASEHSVGYVSRGWRLLFHRPPKHEAEEPCERQPLETRGGESHSVRVLTRRQWKDQHSEGFVVAKETNRAEGELSTRWRGRKKKHMQVQRSWWRCECSQGRTSVCHPLHAASRSGQPLITQRPAIGADYRERNRPSILKGLSWQRSATPVS